MGGDGGPTRDAAVAELAFAQLQAFQLAPTPRNYEVWYAYASAHNRPLNIAIDELLAGRDGVTQDDLDDLYDRFFSPMRMAEQVDTIGTRMIGEIDGIMTVIDGTLRAGPEQRLADAAGQVEDASDINALRNVIGVLAETARGIERNNARFEAHLQDSKRGISELKQHLAAVRSELLTDPLTTLGNRSHFDRAIGQAVAHANSAGHGEVSLLMIDIDHFKRFNDTHGHLTGDQVLRLVALTLKQNLKGRDVAARYGGEEFAIILPDTGLRQATIVAEQVRRAVSASELTKRSTGERLGRVTISIGVAATRRGDSVRSLIGRADNCLYAAKRSGRNRVIGEGDPETADLPAERVA